MKKVFVLFAILTLLSIGAVSFAHGTGGWGGGPMMGYGYGGHMTGPGYGGHMSERSGGYDRNFLDETVDLRRELHNKRFEYSEAVRNPGTDPETIAKLEKEILELQEKIYEKAPRTPYGRYGGHGCNW